MREDLCGLHRMGIYVRDIREDNYIDGKLVDFSRSWTKPHSFLDPNIRSQTTINKAIAGEFVEFDRMLRETGIQTQPKAWSRSNETGRLRSKITKPDRLGF